MGEPRTNKHMIIRNIFRTKLRLLGLAFMQTFIVHTANAQKSPKTKQIPSIPKPPIKLLFDCNLDWASPIGGYGFFMQGSQYYHFAQLGKEGDGKTTEPALRKYGLYKIDLKSFKAKATISLNLPETVSIIPHGDPLIAVIAVVFNENPNHCYRGISRYISFTMQNPQSSRGKLRVIQGKGDLQSIETSGLWSLYDFSRSNALEFDFASYQVRTSYVKTNKNEILLYLDSGRNRYYTWQTQVDNNKRGLVAYEGQGKMAGGVMFEPGDKLIHQKNLFGVAHYKDKSHSIEIIELARWSGRPKRRVYTIYIPRIFELDNTHLKVNFSKKVAVIAASTRKQRKKIKNAAIFDYEKSWLLSTFTAPNNQYVAFEAISPDGAYVAIELRNKITDNTESISIYSVATRKWNKIQIAR